MKHLIAALLLLTLAAPLAQAASCGTFAAPTSCTLTTANRTYTVSGFTIVSSSATGGPVAYTGADISIDIGTGGGGSLLLTFDKVGGNGAFFVNAGETRGLTISYDVTVASTGAGAVAISSPFTVDIVQASSAGTGLAGLQMIVNFNSTGYSCTDNSNGTGSPNCVIPGGQPRSFTVGNLLSLTGGTGNVSVSAFNNLLQTEYIPTTGVDIDGNGSAQALTDGLLVVRYLLGLRGAALIAGATGAAGATRTTAPAIEAYLQSLLP